MNFLNSATTWGALAAAGIAVPILIHLLYRKHRREIEWAAMELLNRALVTRSGQVKIEDWLVLLLRCVAILLLAMALLRPVLNDNASWVGEQRVGVVIALDASYSMGHGGLAESRHEDAVERVREILDTVALEDPVTLVQISDRPMVHFRGTGYNPEKFDEVLETLEPSPLGLSLDKNIEQLEEMVAELKAPVKECYLITDAQEGDWNELSQARREAFSRLAEEANVYLVPTRKSREENLSIRRLAYASGTLTEQRRPQPHHRRGRHLLPGQPQGLPTYTRPAGSGTNPQPLLFCALRQCRGHVPHRQAQRSGRRAEDRQCPARRGQRASGHPGALRGQRPRYQRRHQAPGQLLPA